VCEHCAQHDKAYLARHRVRPQHALENLVHDPAIQKDADRFIAPVPVELEIWVSSSSSTNMVMEEIQPKAS